MLNIEKIILKKSYTKKTYMYSYDCFEVPSLMNFSYHVSYVTSDRGHGYHNTTRLKWYISSKTKLTTPYNQNT